MLFIELTMKSFHIFFIFVYKCYDQSIQSYINIIICI